ncbi:helix-turn-helix transcriptional regulator [Micromonospora sp. CPCC 206060]|uniref:helix-turn-helix domain-containing protein n=1 Tax=Micromonospora sp. CPCC 206060 TaxID=3122406 RepID=UPI002FF05A9D
MTSPTPPALGALLAGLRQARGWSQLRLAAELCTASGVPTLTRHEVSRWERQRRTPGDFWLGWLAVVLGVPVAHLAGARAGAGPDPGRRHGGSRRPPAPPHRPLPVGYAARPTARRRSRPGPVPRRLRQPVRRP